jgi:dihydrofolate reductase
VPRLIYSMSVSLDGYIKGADGSFDWSVPDAELHQFHNDRVRELGCHLLGRRLYETMLYWETVDADPSSGPIERDFASVWQNLPKVVFSSTLTEVEGRNMRLASDDVVSEVKRLKAEPGRDIEVGGAALAADCIRAGLVDEFQLFVNPVVVGGGTPFFPELEEPLPLELLETREFGSRVVYLRYAAR